MAGGEGFEPPQTHPECAVLPLDEPPVTWNEGILPQTLPSVRDR